MTAVPPPTEASIPKGVSPTRLAWQRLRRNPSAMAGLITVTLVNLLCFGAPLFTAHDPERPHTWIGAQPPGYSHPAVERDNRFQLGDTATVPIAAGADTLTYVVERAGSEHTYRVIVRRGAISSIKEGITRFESLDLRGREVTLAGSDGADTLSITAPLVVGDPADAELFAGRRVLMLRVRGQVSQETATISLAPDRTVTDIIVAGDSRQELAIPGAQVVEVLVDGEARQRTHLLGTDAKGRDQFARILYGGRISLLVGIVATAVSLVIGLVYGAVSGFAGGRLDRLMMASVDVLYAIPFMFLVILLLVAFGRNMLVLFAALGAVQWLTIARIIRGQVLSLREREFVDAARLSGASPGTLLFRHLVPNTLGPVIVYTTLTVPIVILEESFLAFIGLQVQWGDRVLDSWGTLVKLGSESPHTWLLWWPSLFMAATLLALNLLGDGLRDALDPHQGDR